MSPKTDRLRLHQLFSDHAVLQQGRPNPVWGLGTPGAVVSLSILQRELSTRVQGDGTWKIDLPALDPQTGMEMKVESGGESIHRRGLAVGEVWLCSGQSNMEWPMQFTENAYEQITAATDLDIRLFTVPRRPSLTPRASLPASSWSVSSPAAVKNFSAVAYFFARKLRRELRLPVGLIHSSWGGSVIQAWLPHPDAAGSEARLEAYSREWRDWVKRECHADPGNEGERLGWAEPSFDDSAWTTMDLPGVWEREGLDIDGAVWFRKNLNLPPHWSGRDLVLHFGRIDDYDTTYFNGHRVGGLDGSTLQPCTAQCVYVVPGHLVRTGENVIATRIFDHAGDGGLLADSTWHFSAILAGRNEQRSLAGSWRMKVECALPPRPATVWESMPKAPLDFYAQFEPSLHRASLFNGMIAPLAPFGLRGILWYQGESNVDEAALYFGLLKELVESWRGWWKDESLAFLVAQLADFIDGRDEPPPACRSPWAELREAQSSILLLENTGLAITRDVGDAYDIHPRNKQAVGLRLALQALQRVYAENIPADGPVFESVTFTSGKAIIQFAHCENGLRTRDGKSLRGFVIAGADGHFYDGNARIAGPSTVEVRHPDLSHPVVARYAWAAFSSANLENSEGLPAEPFRTDAANLKDIS